MAGLERAGFEHGGQGSAVSARMREHLGEAAPRRRRWRSGQAVAFVGELHAVVLEVDVADMGRDRRG